MQKKLKMQKKLSEKESQYKKFHILMYNSKFEIIGFITQMASGNRLELKTSSLHSDFLSKIKGQKVGGVWVEWLD